MKDNTLRWFLLFGCVELIVIAACVGWVIAYATGQQPRAGIEESSDRDSLGERLFNDKALSANGDTSCSTCHLREKAFASDGLPPKQGGGRLARKGPSLLNAKDHPFLFWDGRAKSLEEQVIQPITNKDEMGNATLEPVLVRLAERYKRDYSAVHHKASTAAMDAYMLKPKILPKWGDYRLDQIDPEGISEWLAPMAKKHGAYGNRIIGIMSRDFAAAIRWRRPRTAPRLS